ncbi:MAG: DUF3352 domain-containing protein, partial [Planctomycetes bacterium]|nr:DUF3352 domain-containing protein [Planctomycetota bacterium]
MKHTHRSMGHWLVAAGLLAFGLPALHADGLDAFKLTRAIPADVFMVSHARSHEGQAFLKQQCQRVWDALENAHIERDIRKLLRGLAEAEGQAESFEENWRNVNDLLAGVEWSAIAKQEFAFAMKLEFPAPQWVMLMTPEQGKAESSFESLSGMMQALVDFAPAGELVLTKDDQGDTSVHKIGFTKAPIPIGFVLARHKDTLMFSFGTSMPEQVLAMLSGEGGPSLASSDRFKNAFSGLPTPTDGAFFVDTARLMKQLRDYASNALAMMPPMGDEQDGDAAPDIAKIISNVFDAIDLFDYSATVATTKGKRTESQSVTVLRDGAESTALYAALFANEPISDPLKFIPKQAAEASVSVGVNPAALYKAITDFIKENVPDGQAQIDEFTEQFRLNAGMDLETDVLSWIKGGLTHFAIPGKTPYSTGDWVWMVSVSDSAKATEMLARIIEQIEPMVVAQNGSVSDAVIDGAEGFKAITHPMMAMLPIGKPTIGVAAGQLMLGSSARAIERSLAVAAGKAPNFAKNERFQKEGVMPTG